MKRFVNLFDKYLTKVEEYSIYILMASMLLLSFAGFVSRYVFNAPLSWSEELARYFMIWGTFIAVSYGVRTGAHITLDILVVIFNDKANKILRIVSYTVSLGFCIILLYAGIPFINSLFSSGQSSPAAQIPMYLVYSAIVIGALLMTIRYLILIYDEFTNNSVLSETKLTKKVEEQQL